MKYLFFSFLLVLAACNQKAGKKQSTAINPLKGNWKFLDKYGNYNEAYFGDSVYKTYNKFTNEQINFKYFIKNDSLFSNLDRRKRGLHPVAGLQFLDNDHVVISTEFVRDTLERMTETGFTLENTDPFVDSVNYLKAFYRRYEEFLISRGIITEDEAEQFRKNQVIPEDVQMENQPQ